MKLNFQGVMTKIKCKILKSAFFQKRSQVTYGILAWESSLQI